MTVFITALYIGYAAMQGRSGIHFQPGSVMLKTSPPPIPIQPHPTVVESG